MPPRKKNPKATATTKRIEAARIKHAKRTKELTAKLRAGKKRALQQLPPEEEEDDDLLVEHEDETEREAELRERIATLAKVNNDLRRSLDRTLAQLNARPERDDDPPPIPQPEHVTGVTMTFLRNSIDLPKDANDRDFDDRWSAIRVSA
ncbi:hypothetical protein FRC12_017000 [Ceratobasidium sp. 428]|nr:hypothetical protein FRC12_017000 [Ceratobasidium sp. 428]